MTYISDILTLFGADTIHYLPLDDTTGTTARDASGNSRTGAYTGTYTLGATGVKSSTAVNFNATGEVDAYTASLAAAFDADNGAISVWLAANTAGIWSDATTYNIAFFGASATMYYLMRKNGSDLVLTGISRMGATIPSVSLMPPDTTRWINVAVTWDKAGDKLCLYVNGARGAVTTGLGTWSGSIAALYARYADTSPGIANSPWPGKMAHGLLLGATPTDAQMRLLAEAPGCYVFDGDSRTNLKHWPLDALEAAHPSGDIAFGGYGSGNFARSGWQVSEMITDAATRVDTQIGTGRNILVLWGGVNDAAAGASATTIYTRIKAYCDARRAAGWDKIIVCTEIDAQSAALQAVSWHSTIYPALNIALRAGYTDFADYLVDLGADSRLQDATDTTYFNVDLLHPNDTGYAVVQELITPYLAAAGINTPRGKLTLPAR
jgi:lysophospholipase L1-like esterase